MSQTRRVVMAVPDLFFATRIATTATHLGVPLEQTTANRLVAACRARPPDLVIVDLHGPGDPVGAIRALRGDPATRGVRVVGFHSHVDDSLRAAALAAGADAVLARSAFTRRLAALLGGDAPEGVTPPEAG